MALYKICLFNDAHWSMYPQYLLLILKPLLSRQNFLTEQLLCSCLQLHRLTTLAVYQSKLPLKFGTGWLAAPPNTCVHDDEF